MKASENGNQPQQPHDLLPLHELFHLIGQHCFVRFNKSSGMSISCMIVNVKRAFGHERIEVKPIAGEGTAWVDRWHIEIRD